MHKQSDIKMINKIYREQNKFRVILSIFKNISIRKRRQIYFLILMMLITGIADLVSLGTLLPLLRSFTDPESLYKIPVFKNFLNILSIQNSANLVVIATVVFIFAAVFSSLIKLLTLYLSSMLSASIGSNLSTKAYWLTLNQPYRVHISRNTSDILNTLVIETGNLVSFLTWALKFIIALICFTSILFGLFIINIWIALSSIFIFGGIYLLLTYWKKTLVSSKGKKITLNNEKLIRAIQEGFGSIRDLILDNKQNYYSKIYKLSDRAVRITRAEIDIISTYPYYIIEALAFVAIAIMGMFLSLNSNAPGDSIALLGVVALGWQRLLRSLQQIYLSWMNLNAKLVGSLKVLELLDQPIFDSFGEKEKELLTFSNTIELRDVSFSYEKNFPILTKINLKIECGEKIGIIGKTGCGKSTLIDILMGLLIPDKGTVLVDGKSINNEDDYSLKLKWFNTIAHVPQNIYLPDASFAENIAFGISKENIDIERVKKAANKAQISSFIESSSKGYYTSVGERGLRLSGGQRQRIGLARALYSQSKLIVLDEATSALDESTEQKVMKEIENINKKITVIIIAHRLKTLKNCDRVINVYNEKIVEVNKSTDLLETDLCLD